MTDQLQEDLRALRETGHIALAKQYKDMATTLRVIHTWAARCPGGGVLLDRGHTERLCADALRRFRP